MDWIWIEDKTAVKTTENHTHHIRTLVLGAEPGPSVGEAVGWVLLAIFRLASLVVDIHHPGNLVVRAELSLLPGECCSKKKKNIDPEMTAV